MNGFLLKKQELDSVILWVNPETIPALIKFLINTGFKAIRISITCHNHLKDNTNT